MILDQDGSLLDDKQANMRVAVIQPTTGSWNRVSRIMRRDLVTSVVTLFRNTKFLQPVTNDYHCLVSGVLPLLAPLVQPGPYWLEISGSKIDYGESWHVPVLLGHVVHALGAELVEDLREADLVLWSTGAVDAVLDVVDHDYQLDKKVGNIRTDQNAVQRAAWAQDEVKALREAAEAGVQIICFLPARTDATPLRNLLEGIGAKDARVEHLKNVKAAVPVLEATVLRSVPAVPSTNPPLLPSRDLESEEQDSVPAAPLRDLPPYGGVAATTSRHVPAGPAAITAIMVAVALVAVASNPTQITQTAGWLTKFLNSSGVGDQVPEARPGDVEKPARRDVAEGEGPGAGRQTKPPTDDVTTVRPADTVPPVVPVKLQEFRAANNGTCIPYIIGRRTPPQTIDVTLNGPDTFRDSLGTNLCMLEWTVNPDARGVQGFDIEPPRVPGVRLSGTGPVGAWTKVRMEFTRDFASTSPIPYTVKLKFNGAPLPDQKRQFQHTLKSTQLTGIR
jgi:hypothetical protein